MTVLDPPLLPHSETDTRPEYRGPGPVRRARNVRRVLLGLFGTFLLLGALGVFGVRSGEVRAAAGSWALEVVYPRVTRPGHSVPLRFRVHKDGGFGSEPVAIRVTASYFDLFDENAVDPEPSASTATGEDLIYEFDPPPGEELLISVDTRTGPNRMRGAAATVAVLDRGSDAVSVTFRTTVMP